MSWKTCCATGTAQDQYYFYNRTGEIPELSRLVSAAEHQEAQDIARRFGRTGQSG
jgi:uncharacterized Fe-S radical SAM superfamily protein PflX